MAVVDKSAVALDGPVTFVELPAAVAGQSVRVPSRTRVIQASAAVAFRVALEDLDGITLTDQNSLYYPANATHDIWPQGVTPGARAQSTKVHPTLGLVLTFAGASADQLSLSFRS